MLRTLQGVILRTLQALTVALCRQAVPRSHGTKFRDLPTVPDAQVWPRVGGLVLPDTKLARRDDLRDAIAGA